MPHNVDNHSNEDWNADWFFLHARVCSLCWNVFFLLSYTHVCVLSLGMCSLSWNVFPSLECVLFKIGMLIDLFLSCCVSCHGAHIDEPWRTQAMILEYVRISWMRANTLTKYHITNESCALRIPSPKFGEGSKLPIFQFKGYLLPSPNFGEGIRNVMTNKCIFREYVKTRSLNFLSSWENKEVSR